MLYRITSQFDKDRIVRIIQSLEGRYDITVNPTRDKRTIRQNKLMWLWLACISDETGFETDELHEFFKKNYLTHKQVNVFGQDIEQPISTTKLNTLEFTQYLDRIQKFASSELGIYLPNPEDQNWEEFEEQYKDKI